VKFIGPNGYGFSDYMLASSAGPIISKLDEDEIHRLLMERLVHKKNRDFARADAIRDFLAAASVAVCDRAKEWRADGEGWFGHAASSQAYKQSSKGLRVEDEVAAQYIADALARRLKARMDRNFEVADAIRDELKKDYNVVIHDRFREWSVLGNVGTST
jgi:cysteinyl-tRNA synthetase